MTFFRCPLCSTPGTPFFNDEWNACPQCRGLFRPPSDYPARNDERERYEEHNNNVHDERYQGFVSPIVDAVLRDHSPSEQGLDFGSGTAPVISHLLRQQDFNIVCYDPFFANEPALLERRYDFIVCCEVIEHFHDPAAEFARLKDLLMPGGRLYCMTMLHHDGIDFQNWHYRRDPTHVFIYREETIGWIADRFGFADVSIEGRLITFSV